MSEEKDVNTEMTNVQQIIQHAINKEPSQMKNLVNKEIASRVMTGIDAKRADVGAKIFGKA